MREHRAKIKSLRGSAHCGEYPAPGPATPKCYHMALARSYRLFPYRCLMPKVMTFVWHMKICSREALHSRLSVAERMGSGKGAALLGFPGPLEATLSRGKSKVKSLSCVQLFATPWTVGHQASLSMGFPRQEYWSGLPGSPPGDLLNTGIKPPLFPSCFFCFAGRFFTH